MKAELQVNPYPFKDGRIIIGVTPENPEERKILLESKIFSRASNSPLPAYNSGQTYQQGELTDFKITIL
jgi:hypothetical protein